MLVLTLGCVFLVLLIPLTAWALVAQTRFAGLPLAAALLTCGSAWFSLMVGWVAPDEVANIVLLLALITPALIMAGQLADGVTGIAAGRSAWLRFITGPSLAVVCVCLNVGVFAALVVASLYLSWTYTPPSSDVLPLPAALTVVRDQDQGCQGASSEGCFRAIDVKSASGLSPQRTEQLVAEALVLRHNWRLDTVLQNGCRYEGWLLGRELVCVQVQTGQGNVQVLLQGGGS